MECADARINPQNAPIQNGTIDDSLKECNAHMDLDLHPQRTHATLNAAEQNTESSFCHIPTHRASRLLIFFCSLSYSLSLSSTDSSPSPRPNAAHNSRSQFSISADFSIRLRGAAMCTDSKNAVYLLHGKLLLPLVPNSGMSHRRYRELKSTGDLSLLSPPPRVSLTSG